MRQPLVSIIIPCFNAGNWLALTLDSALEQTCLEKEVIVVDDGSTDDSTHVAQAFKARGVRVLSQTNRGASAARNLGLAEATGDFIQFLDADDLLHPRKVESQLDLLGRSDPGTVASGRWGRFESVPAYARFVDDPVFRNLTARSFLRLAAQQGRMMHPAAWLTPTAVAHAAGPWDESLTLNDDGEYFARVLLASAGIVHCPEALSYYRSGISSSLSQRSDEASQRSLFRSVELIASHMLRDDPSLESRQAIGDLYKRLLHELYPAPKDLLQQTLRRIKEFGGVVTPPPMGPRAKILAGLIGWKATRRLAKFFRR